MKFKFRTKREKKMIRDIMFRRDVAYNLMKDYEEKYNENPEDKFYEEHYYLFKNRYEEFRFIYNYFNEL